MLDELDLGGYAVGGSDAAWDAALAGSRAVKGGRAPPSLSVKRDAGADPCKLAAVAALTQHAEHLASDAVATGLQAQDP